MNYIDWLLAGPPWVQYRTRLDLLDQPEDHPQVVEARQAMLAHAQVRGLLKELRGWPGPALSSHKSAGHLLHKLVFLAVCRREKPHCTYSQFSGGFPLARRAKALCFSLRRKVFSLFRRFSSGSRRAEIPLGLGGLRHQHMQALQVEAQTDQAPLARCGCQTPQGELPKAQDFFDNANHRFHGALP